MPVVSIEGKARPGRHSRLGIAPAAPEPVGSTAVRDTLATRRILVPPLDVRPQQGRLEVNDVADVAAADESHVQRARHELLIRTVHEAAESRRLVDEAR